MVVRAGLATLVLLSQLGAGEPGLFATFEANGKRDARPSRMAALFVPSGMTATPFLEAGRFKATFDGALSIDARDDYRFAAKGRGTLEVSLDQKLVLKAEGEDFSKAPPATVPLRKGRVRIEIRYEAPRDGDAFFRLEWSSADFGREPIPAALLSHETTAAGSFPEKQALLREGLEALRSRRCVACHVADGVAAEPGPSLDGIGTRVRREWLERWIEDPSLFRSTAHMPRVFVGPAAGGGLGGRAIAAFLSLAAEGDTVDGAEKSSGSAARGAELFLDMACLGCHKLGSGAAQKSDDGRVDLAHVGGKWRPRALIEFLLEPEKRFPAIGMPNFLLSKEEAEHLAAFLFEQSPPPATPSQRPSRQEAEMGGPLLMLTGCLTCHPLTKLEGLAPRRPSRAKPLDALRARPRAGCLDPNPGPDSRAPRFALSERERSALAAFLESDASASAPHDPVEVFERAFANSTGCGGCHARDSRPERIEGLSHEIQSIESWLSAKGVNPKRPAVAGEALDQSRPRLTWTGEKLRADWTRKYLSGELPREIRPWLRSRMPVFRHQAALLAAGLAREHGFSPVDSGQSAKADGALAALGRKLLKKEGGFGCVACHDVGASKAQGSFEVRGIDFRFTAERVREEFFHRWMLNPVRVSPEARMPQFAELDGRSPFADVLGGDARVQFGATWHALQAGRELRLDP